MCGNEIETREYGNENEKIRINIYYCPKLNVIFIMLKVILVYK